MTIAFDTVGFRHVGRNRWVRPETGDVVTFRDADGVPDLPGSLTDIGALRRELVRAHAQTGCLVDARVVSVDGLPSVAQVVKVPQKPHGVTVLGSLTVPRATRSAVVRIESPENGVTGMRESELISREFLRTGEPYTDAPHPYAPELHSHLRYFISDEEVYDDEFPGHPLSRARQFLWRVVATAFVDPGFAALGEYAPD